VKACTGIYCKRLCTLHFTRMCRSLEGVRAREYAAQLARPAAQPAAGHRQGQEYVVHAVPMLFRAPCHVTEPCATTVELTERT